MKRPQNFFFRFSALFLSISLILPPDHSFAAPVAPQDLFKIPEKIGRLEEFHEAPSGKSVIYIQDAHDSLDAQKNIAALIDYFTTKRGVETVFTEGYEGPAPSDKFFGFIKDPKIKEKVSYFLMDKLRLGGAEYAHVNRKKNFKLIGADDAGLHRKNIAAYREAMKLRKDVQKDLKSARTEIKGLMDRHFPREMKEHMKLTSRFHAGKTGLLDYLKRLGLSIDITSIQEPKFLFQKIDQAENDFARRFLSNERDWQTFQYDKTLELLQRFSRLKITPGEYAALKDRLDRFSTQELAGFISEHAQKSAILSKRWEKKIASAVRFYEIAHERDAAIQKKLEEFKKSEEKTAVLIFGGFHKEGIKKILAGHFSYAVVAPKISKIEARHQSYYKQLMSTGHLPFETQFMAARALKQEITLQMEPNFARSEIRGIYEAALQGDIETILSNSVRSEMRSASEPSPVKWLNSLSAGELFERMRGVFAEGKVNWKNEYLAWKDLKAEKKKQGAGVLLLRKIDGQWRFLLGRNKYGRKKGYFVAPAGGVDKTTNPLIEKFAEIDLLESIGISSHSDFNPGMESTPAAALRELKEESGITGRIAGRIDDVYGPEEGVLVSYFVVIDPSNMSAVPGGDGELEDFRWIPLETIFNTVPGKAGPAVQKLLPAQLVEGLEEDGFNNLRTLLETLSRSELRAVPPRIDNVATLDEALALMEKEYASYNPSDASSEPPDQILMPVVIGEPDDGNIKPEDAIFYINFRTDRTRQLTGVFTHTDPKEGKAFTAFAVPDSFAPHFTAMTHYADTLHPHEAFGPVALQNTLSDYWAALGLRQLHVSETEKKAHTTFFLAGQRDVQHPLEDWVHPQSTGLNYAEAPEMQAAKVGDTVVDSLINKKHDVIFANFANPDMVGHTGNFEAAKKAVEAVDAQLARIIQAAEESNAVVAIFADHGNAEEMVDEKGQPHTKHTFNRVPFILKLPGQPVQINFRALTDTFDDSGNPPSRLADIYPTIFGLYRWAVPKEVNGKNLILNPETLPAFDVKQNPLVMVVLDGWGMPPEKNPRNETNAVLQADTPAYDKLIETSPWTQLYTHGKYVGLPDDIFGNSEIGHMSIGSGRTIPTDIERINNAIASGDFFQNPALLAMSQHVLDNGSKLHVLGLLTEAGVHAHQSHWDAMLEFADRKKIKEVRLHLFTDGRDGPPTGGVQLIKDFQSKIDAVNAKGNTHVKIARIMGRQWAMDRDRRWGHTQLAFDAMVHGATTPGALYEARSEMRPERKRLPDGALVAQTYRELGYFRTLDRLGINPRNYYDVLSGYAKSPDDDTDYFALNYDEAVRLVEDPETMKPFNTLNSRTTAVNLVLAALDTIPGFRTARESNNIKEMAALYRHHVMAYKPEDKTHDRNGQQAFFRKIGLNGLFSIKRSYLTKTGSPATLIRLVLPQLIDVRHPDALDPPEVEKKYWNDPDNARYHIFLALDAIEGFAEAREKNDIKKMAELYRLHVINYKSKKGGQNGQIVFFEEKGGLKGLLGQKQSYIAKTDSPAAMLRFAIPGLIDEDNPDALKPLEVENNYWTDPDNAKRHILAALDKIEGFKDAREKNDLETMARLYRQHVIPYKAKDQEKYPHNGQTAYFYEVGGMRGLMKEERPFLAKKGSAPALLRFALPGLIDEDNPKALHPLEVDGDYWKDANHVRSAVLKALDTIPGFKEAREKEDTGAMAGLYRRHVIEYTSVNKDKYPWGGQFSFFAETGGLRGLLQGESDFFETGSPGSLVRFVLPKLIDDTNPSALSSEEVFRSELRSSSTNPYGFETAEIRRLQEKAYRGHVLERQILRAAVPHLAQDWSNKTTAEWLDHLIPTHGRALRIIDIGFDAADSRPEFMESLLPLISGKAHEAYSLGRKVFEWVRPYSADLKKQKHHGSYLLKEGDYALDFSRQLAKHKQFDLAFMNAPDPHALGRSDNLSWNDYADEAALLSKNLLIVRFTPYEEGGRLSFAFMDMLRERGFEYVGTVTNLPKDFPLTYYTNHFTKMAHFELPAHIFRKKKHAPVSKIPPENAWLAGQTAHGGLETARRFLEKELPAELRPEFDKKMGEMDKLRRHLGLPEGTEVALVSNLETIQELMKNAVTSPEGIPLIPIEVVIPQNSGSPRRSIYVSIPEAIWLTDNKDASSYEINYSPLEPDKTLRLIYRPGSEHLAESTEELKKFRLHVAADIADKSLSQFAKKIDDAWVKYFVALAVERNDALALYNLELFVARYINGDRGHKLREEFLAIRTKLYEAQKKATIRAELRSMDPAIIKLLNEAIPDLREPALLLLNDPLIQAMEPEIHLARYDEMSRMTLNQNEYRWVTAADLADTPHWQPMASPTQRLATRINIIFKKQLLNEEAQASNLMISVYWLTRDDPEHGDFEYRVTATLGRRVENQVEGRRFSYRGAGYSDVAALPEKAKLVIDRIKKELTHLEALTQKRKARELATAYIKRAFSSVEHLIEKNEYRLAFLMAESMNLRGVIDLFKTEPEAVLAEMSAMGNEFQQEQEAYRQKTANLLAAEPGKIQIITGYQKLNVQLSRVRNGVTGWEGNPAEEVQKIRKILATLKPEVIARIEQGEILLQGPGRHIHEILALMEVFPNARISVADPSFINLVEIKNMLDDRGISPDKVRLAHADFARMPFPEHFFDAAFSSHVIDHSLIDIGILYASADPIPSWIIENRRALKAQGVYLARTADKDYFINQGFKLRFPALAISHTFAAAKDDSVFVRSEVRTKKIKDDRKAARLEQLDALETDYRKTLALNPADVTRRIDLARLLGDRNRHDEAAEMYLSVLDYEPDNVYALSSAALVYIGQKKYSKAETLAQRAMKPKENAESFYLLGFIRHQQKRLLEAEKNYRRALELKPELWQNMGINYRHLLSDLVLHGHILQSDLHGYLYFILRKNDFTTPNDLISPRSEMRNEAIKIMRELILKDANHDFNADAELVRSLIGKKFPPSNKDGDIRIPTQPGFSRYEWAIVGKKREGYEGEIIAATVHGHYFEIEVVLRKEGEEDITRVFQAGGMTAPVSGRDANKDKKIQTLLISHQLAKEQLAPLLRMPQDYYWLESEETIKSMVGKNLGKISGHVITLNGGKNYQYVWPPFPFDANGYHGKIIATATHPHFFEFEVLWEKDTSEPVKVTYQVGRQTHPLRPLRGTPPKNALNISSHLGGNELAALLARPLEHDWTKDRKKIFELVGKRIQKTGDRGRIALNPDSHKSLLWVPLHKSKTGYEGVITKAEVYPGFFQFTVRWTKNGARAVTKTYQVGGNFVQKAKSPEKEAVQVHRITTQLGRHALHDLIQKPRFYDWTQEAKTAANLIGKKIFLRKDGVAWTTRKQAYKWRPFKKNDLSGYRGTVTRAHAEKNFFEFEILWKKRGEKSRRISYQIADLVQSYQRNTTLPEAAGQIMRELRISSQLARAELIELLRYESSRNWSSPEWTLRVERLAGKRLGYTTSDGVINFSFGKNHFYPWYLSGGKRAENARIIESGVDHGLPRFVVEYRANDKLIKEAFMITSISKKIKIRTDRKPGPDIEVFKIVKLSSLTSLLNMPDVGRWGHAPTRFDEDISAPDAFENASYKEITAALKLFFESLANGQKQIAEMLLDRIEPPVIATTLRIEVSNVTDLLASLQSTLAPWRPDREVRSEMREDKIKWPFVFRPKEVRPEEIESVSVRGGFQNWEEPGLSLTQQGGLWAGEFELLPATYEYKYFVRLKNGDAFLAAYDNDMYNSERQKDGYQNYIVRVGQIYQRLQDVHDLGTLYLLWNKQRQWANAKYGDETRLKVAARALELAEANPGMSGISEMARSFYMSALMGFEAGDQITPESEIIQETAMRGLVKFLKIIYQAGRDTLFTAGLVQALESPNPKLKLAAVEGILFLLPELKARPRDFSYIEQKLGLNPDTAGEDDLEDKLYGLQRELKAVRSELRKGTQISEKVFDKTIRLQTDAIFTIRPETLEALLHWPELLGLKILNNDKLHIAILADKNQTPGARALELMKKPFKNVSWEWNPALTQMAKRGAPVIQFEKLINGKIPVRDELREADVIFDLFEQGGSFLAAFQLLQDPEQMKIWHKKIITQASASTLGLLKQFFDTFAIVAHSA